MNAHERLVQRVDEELDDLLATSALVRNDAQLSDRIFTQLVDLLVEQSFLTLREEHLSGSLDRGEYLESLAELADSCRRTGLLPLPTR